MWLLPCSLRYHPNHHGGAECKLLLGHLRIGYRFVGGGLEELGVTRVESPGDVWVAGYVVPEKDFEPHATEEVLPCGTGVVAVHVEGRGAAVFFLQDQPAWSECPCPGRAG